MVGALVGFHMAQGLKIGGDFGAKNLFWEIKKRFDIAHEDMMKIGFATHDYNRLAATFSLLRRLDLETIDDDLDLRHPDKES